MARLFGPRLREIGVGWSNVSLAAACYLCGARLEVEHAAGVGRGMIRDYINATCGFGALSRATKTPAKSLMRMFGASGNPSLKNLSAVVGELQRHEGIRLHVQGERRTA